MTNISNLTPEERAALREEFQAEEKQKASQRDKEIETYKGLVDKAVAECFPLLEIASRDLAIKKSYIREQFSSIVELKAELYNTKEEQHSHSFISADGKRRVRIGYNLIDEYDDTVNTGIQKVREFISSLAKDKDTELLVDTVMQLLSKDKKGTLKASRVLQLQQMAEKTEDLMFLEGVKIIRDAYKPIESKSYIRAEFKNDIGVWESVPLGMTEA